VRALFSAANVSSVYASSTCRTVCSPNGRRKSSAWTALVKAVFQSCSLVYPGGVTVLKVLASQAAISIENSPLYRDLEDREGKIRRLADANILGIFIWNLEGAIVEGNEAFLRMLQYSRDDLVSGRVGRTDGSTHRRPCPVK
jgi:PAS domain-containing protein